MIIDRLFTGMGIYERGLDATSMRSRVITNNIANVDTPDFKSSSVDFESALMAAMDQTELRGKKTREAHMDIGPKDASSVVPAIVQDDAYTLRMDGNNVDIDEQMTQLADNQLQYSALTQKISGSFEKLRLAIRGGQ